MAIPEASMLRALEQVKREELKRKNAESKE
jgi:hypothetical protein